MPEAGTSPDVDAFIIAVPDTLHLQSSVQALGSGKPVLLEKPLAHSLSVVKTIVAKAHASRSRLLVGHLLRYDPRYATAAAAVRAGNVGRPLHLNAGRIAPRAVGIRLAGLSSVLFYLGIHDVDAIQWITGSRIKRVYSRSVNMLLKGLGVPSKDVILSLVELENGAVGTLWNGWTRTDADPVQIDGRLELFGTTGTLEIDVRRHGLTIQDSQSYALPDALHWPETNGRIGGDLVSQLEHFVDAVTTEGPFLVSVEEALSAVAVNDAILRSVSSGEAQTVEDVRSA